MPPAALPRVPRETVTRLWFARQGLSRPRGSSSLSKRRFLAHLEQTGALQLDSINVVARAHELTLWTRFGPYDPARVQRWIHRDRAAYEYWGHEASILPVTHLPLGLRRMRGFPPRNVAESTWWSAYETSTGSKRRVLRRLRDEGPLESAHFEADSDATRSDDAWAGSFTKEDRRSLRILWHSGRIAVANRRHFRRVFDLAERVYPDVQPATTAALEDSWLFTGLSGNGIASERHLVQYWTGPKPDAATRRRVIARNLKRGRIVAVEVDGVRGPCLALPEHLESLDVHPEPEGTTLVGPFDSLLWQRQRARDLLDFHYRVEIYVPPPKREFGYYSMPILHDGRLVGRLDPKLHRDRGELEIKSLHLEPGVRRTKRLEQGLAHALAELGHFVGAEQWRLPRGWAKLL